MYKALYLVVPFVITAPPYRWEAIDTLKHLNLDRKSSQSLEGAIELLGVWKMEFGRRLGSIAAGPPAKLHSDTNSSVSNPAGSRL